MNWNNRISKGSLLAVIVWLGLSNNAYSQSSKIFDDYVKAQQENREAMLPNFSYAGVDHGQKIQLEQTNLTEFKVVDYGAIPDDGQSDRSAIKKAIMAAMESGGIVIFPKGRLDINTADDKPEPLIIKLGDFPITLQGHAEGTEIFMENILPSPTPDKLWSTPYMIQFKGNKKETLITTVEESAIQGSKTIVVKEANDIQPNDWIALSLVSKNPKLMLDELQDRPLSPTWKKIVQGGVKIKAVHQVESVDGNTITLKSCLLKGINSEYNWEVYSVDYHDGLVIKDLQFTGTWKEPFKHHKNLVHDGGHSMLSLTAVTNFTVMNCTFTDVNRALHVRSGVNGTIINNVILGNGGHNGISLPACTNVLAGMNKDMAGQWHTYGVSNESIGNVFWRNEHAATTSFESHASQPRTTLYDCAKGGFIFGRLGGAIGSLPNHMEELVLWNYNETDESEENYEFWSSVSKYGKVVPPIIVGFHGSGTTFKTDQLEQFESIGTKVEPESLYEAQMELRLGYLPEWIKNIKAK
ncbi:MAG: DUF4955 domain-containing protein [Cyclobacteriaceae bacterium]